MLPTHRKHACPVCLHASHDGKLITHLRKRGLFRNFPPDCFLPSSESGRVLYPPSPLFRLNHCLSFLPSSRHTRLPSSLSSFSFLSFSLFSSPHLHLSHHPSFPLPPPQVLAACRGECNPTGLRPAPGFPGPSTAGQSANQDLLPTYSASSAGGTTCLRSPGHLLQNPRTEPPDPGLSHLLGPTVSGLCRQREHQRRLRTWTRASVSLVLCASSSRV